MPSETVLCTAPRVTVLSLTGLLKGEDREPIADFIERRFLERYLDPIESLSANRKNGFTIMALCCLTIEALQSFREGLPTSDGNSKAIFQRFLGQEVEFIAFRGCWLEFYKNVRCGILHQAETTNGWRVRRSGPLFDPETLQINATKFQIALKKTLANYVNDLKRQNFDSDEWIKCRRKLDSIIVNCVP